MKALNRALELLAILGAVTAGVFYFSADKISTSNGAKLIETQSKLQFEVSKSKTLAQRLSEQKEEFKEIDEKLANAKSETAALDAKLNQLLRENQRFAELDENSRITRERLQNENARLSKELALLKANTVSREEITAYEVQIAELQRKVLDLKQTAASSYAESFAEKMEISSVPNLQGNVLTVGKGASFVVLDIGYSDGVRLKTEFNLLHADTQIAKIQVTEVKENLSIARVLPESLSKTPQTGDRVSSRN